MGKGREKNRKRHKRMCYNCDACNLKVDCGKCDFCQDQPKFGGKNLKRQKCRMRQCSRFSRFASQGWRRGSHDALKVMLSSRQTYQLMPSNAIHTSSRSTPQRLHHHCATRSQKEVDERKARQRENKRRRRMKRKLLLESEKTKQTTPGKASHPCFKTQPQVVLNGKFQLKHLQVGGECIAFRDLFVKVHNLMGSMKDQNLNKKARYLEVGGQQIRVHYPFVKLQNLKNSTNDQALNKETPETIPNPLSTDLSQEEEGSGRGRVGKKKGQEEEGSHVVESEPVTVVPRSYPLSLCRNPVQGKGSNSVYSEGMTMIRSKSLVLATIFYKKVEIRKRKYRIFTIKELIEVCKEELDYYIHGNHNQLERIQIYDTDFSEYVDFDTNKDDIKDKDRFFIYFGESRCQCAVYLDPETISAESSNVYPSKPGQPPPSNIDDYLIQEEEDTERDSRMPVIVEILSLGSCMAVSRSGMP